MGGFFAPLGCEHIALTGDYEAHRWSAEEGELLPTGRAGRRQSPRYWVAGPAGQCRIIVRSLDNGLPFPSRFLQITAALYRADLIRHYRSDGP
jgi:hypothetical protein